VRSLVSHPDWQPDRSLVSQPDRSLVSHPDWQPDWAAQSTAGAREVEDGLTGLPPGRGGDRYDAGSLPDGDPDRYEQPFGGQRGPAARLRWQPDRRAALAVGAAVLVAVVGTLWWVLSARARSVAVHASGPSAPVSGAATQLHTTLASRAPAATGSPSAAVLVVDVAGKVRHPGVYRLPPGARVVDAVAAAGGVVADASTASVNLAAPLHDGEQVAIGVPGAPAQPATDTGPGGAAGGSVNLNSATLAQLEQLPGVGPVLAQHILDWRQQHGHFDQVRQLTEVSGIGPAKFATLRPLVTV
jgi:competence protein ComEA